MEHNTSRMLTFSELKPQKGIPWCREHIWRLEKEDRFPKRVRLGSRVCWLETEIDRWLAERVAARDAA